MTTSRSPLAFVEWMLDIDPRIEALEFSIYNYEPRCVEESRRTWRVHPRDLDLFLQEANKEARELRHELAFHSRVLVRATDSVEIRHVPLIDFRFLKKSRNVLGRVLRVAEEFGVRRVELYESGRSMHLYAGACLPTPRWVAFMGRLLLLNPPSDPGEIIDSRWVGHRLLGGFASLRWSANGAQYRQEPSHYITRNLRPKKESHSIGLGFESVLPGGQDDALDDVISSLDDVRNEDDGLDWAREALKVGLQRSDCRSLLSNKMDPIDANAIIDRIRSSQ